MFGQKARCDSTVWGSKITRRSWWVYSTDNIKSTTLQLPVGRRLVSGDDQDRSGKVLRKGDVRWHGNMRCDQLTPGGAQATSLNIQALFLFTAARDKWAQETCQPTSSDWQLKRTDGEVRLQGKESYPLPIWRQITAHGQHHGWLAIFLIIHKAWRHTAHFLLPSRTAPGRFLNIATARALGRKGVSKKGNFLVSGYGAWPLTQCYCGPVILSVERGRGDKCCTLPSTLNERRADLGLTDSRLGKAVLTGLAAILTNMSSHPLHNEVLPLTPDLYGWLTIYVSGAVLRAYTY